MVVSLLIVIVLMVIVTLRPENAGALSNVRMLRFDDDWGTHRGLNWKCSVAGFIRMNPLRKIIGMGQGNFEAYIYSFGDLADRLVLMYGEFRLRVAHNEYLNMLIENGILGLVSYAGFIVSSFTFLWKRADENRLSLIALLSLAGYFACSVFFFQQFYATPYMYLFIAMAISGIREEK